MLPSDLLIHRPQGETVIPKYLPLQPAYVVLAKALIGLFRSAVDRPQTDLDRQLSELEGENTDYRIQRGLAHLLKTAFCTFEVVSPLAPLELRQRLFAAAALEAPSLESGTRLLQQLAETLTIEQERPIFSAEVQAALYADLPQNHRLIRFEAPSPEALIHRYNLAQVQGIFYRATQVRMNLHRNDPGEYKYLFRFLKLFGLMTYIEGEPDTGFTLIIDGPTSLFQANTHYGLALAKLLPALLHVTRWSLEATLKQKDPYTKVVRTLHYHLEAGCSLVSHYPPGKPFDSMIEASFAEQWSSLKTDWKLEREVQLLPIPGSVMIPDFRLVHPDGRVVILEIIGYWRPAYLQKKFAQVRKVHCPHLMLAISERLNLEKAGVKLENLPAEIVWFREKLSARNVLKALETIDFVKVD